MRCLEKDRTRRYESASSLAKDIERHLSDEPVEACPPRAVYRLGKFVRRNQRPILASSLVLLAVIAGLAGTTWGFVQAEHQRRRAMLAAEVAARQAEIAQRRAAEDQRHRAK
jgi:eukaryotic-like serine/threonine-protein kinase